VRFHFGHRGRRGNYSLRELEEWARRIDAWRTDGEVYAYFNNDWSGFAPRNAAWLDSRLSELADERPRIRGRSSKRLRQRRGAHAGVS
jgi:uncharacterized protein YecE (DUF72 family)